jgi:hypothetical protein
LWTVEEAINGLLTKMKNWKETATNTALMFKCLFSCNIFHLMKKASSNSSGKGNRRLPWLGPHGRGRGELEEGVSSEKLIDSNAINPKKLTNPSPCSHNPKYPMHPLKGEQWQSQK